MNKDDDLTGWRRLAKESQDERRKWLEMTKSALGPNRPLRFLEQMEDVTRPNHRLEEALRRSEDALSPSRRLQEHLRQMEDAIRPSQQVRESLRQMEEVLGRPSRQLQEHLRQMEDATRPSQQVRESLRQMEEVLGRPSRQLQEHLRQMEDATRPSQQVREALRQMEEVLRPSRQLEKRLAYIQGEPTDWVALFEAPQRQLNDLFEKQQRELRTLQGALGWQRVSGLSELNSALRELVQKHASALVADNVSIGPDGDMVVDKLTTLEELSATVGRLTSDLITASTILDYVRRLTQFLDSLTGPLKALFLHLLLPYLISVAANLTTPIVQDYWRHLVGTARKEIAVAIREAANSQYDAAHLEAYRFVTARRLRVHARPDGQDDVVTQISYGKLVKVLENRGRRTLVEFLDMRNESSRGWVATRYLAAFSK